MIFCLLQIPATFFCTFLPGFSVIPNYLMICMCVCNMFQVPASGMLILTDEEKRTLIAEGYSVPTRWPLTKQDEKNLKKVQRKIKNKVVKHTMCYIHYTVVAMMHLYCTIHSSDTVKLLFLRHLCCSLDLHFPCI